ncbi:MATE family efflux transporter [Rubrivivax sp. A210]|uniref:MATE family efflux transporter n=1 Tax=Rubrivivax sp. A210 TaxID=2772301 RepID=UPI0019A9EB9D|nr:MATE family efflux transporter [Rubrivivax sp. A210]CAD5371887.1 MATE family efflux transporter [Rubrivivax sp. A210]
MSLPLPPQPGHSPGASLRRILPLAWPVFVGQVSVLAFATIDTLLVARASAADLAALAVGGATYVTVFIGCMGILMALMPIAGQLHGAGRDAEAGRQAHQAVWIALGLSALGCAVLVFPAPFLALARAGPEVAAKVRAYLLGVALALPASLLFTVFRALNNGVSRPKAVMAIQLGGLAVKAPMSAALVFGLAPLGLPALGAAGCGIATALAMWAQLLLSAWVLKRDAFYAPFALLGRGLDRPRRAPLLEQLRLGLPMGASIMVEVTGFTFMAIFISRLGTTPVAGHQIAVNLVSLLFMMPLAIGNAGSTLVAQRIGAGDLADARRLGGHSLLLGCSFAAVVGSAVFFWREQVLGLYTSDAAVMAAALPLLAWVALFHVADGAQIIAAFVLRAYKVATVPLVIYVTAMWGVGLGGGWVLAFDLPGSVPLEWQGARGFWLASTTGLVLAGVALSVEMGRVMGRSGVVAMGRRP